MEITPVSSLPAAPTGESATVKHFIGGGMMRVRMKLTSGALVAAKGRPWFYSDGEWWPLRADGGGGANTEPVTADPAKYDRKADALYATGGLSHFICFRLESGNVADVEKLYIEPADVRS